MSKFSQTAGFAARLWAQRASTRYLAHVKHEPLAMLQTRKGIDDPYAIYRRMRKDGTLAPTPLGNWSTASHRVCSAVLRDRRFGVQQDEQLNMSLLGMNPPDHTRFRRLAEGSFDLVSAFAEPLPISVITDLLGIPDADSKEFAEHGAVVGSALDGIQSLRQASRFVAANAKLHSLFQNVFELRRREPADDLISRLIAAEGDQVKPEELEPMVFLLLIAGFETTVNVIGNGVLALMTNPEQWEALRAEPERLAPKAVEEALRYDPPVQNTGRVALEELELEGRRVQQGQWVLTMIGGAGGDPEVYERPDAFDIDRENPAEHLAFSGGVHYCVGQPLALMELTIAMQLLAERMPKLKLAGPVPRRRTSTIRGLRRLPLSVGK